MWDFSGLAKIVIAMFVIVGLIAVGIGIFIGAQL